MLNLSFDNWSAEINLEMLTNVPIYTSTARNDIFHIVFNISREMFTSWTRFTADTSKQNSRLPEKVHNRRIYLNLRIIDNQSQVNHVQFKTCFLICLIFLSFEASMSRLKQAMLCCSSYNEKSKVCAVKRVISTQERRTLHVLSSQCCCT